MSVIGQPYEDDLDSLTAWCGDLLDQIASLEQRLRQEGYARSQAERRASTVQDEIAWRTA